MNSRNMDYLKTAVGSLLLAGLLLAGTAEAAPKALEQELGVATQKSVKSMLKSKGLQYQVTADEYGPDVPRLETYTFSGSGFGIEGLYDVEMAFDKGRLEVAQLYLSAMSYNNVLKILAGKYKLVTREEGMKDLEYGWHRYAIFQDAGYSILIDQMRPNMQTFVLYARNDIFRSIQKSMDEEMDRKGLKSNTESKF